MNSTPQTDPRALRPVDEPAGRQFVDALKRYLSERGYARQTLGNYLRCAVHFFRWIERSALDMGRIDELLIGHFLNNHLPHCDCGWPARSDPRESHAALGHLLLVLRTLGITEARPARLTPVDEELRRFDEHMDQARGLAPKTRGGVLRIVRALLRERFGNGPVVVSRITPEHVRRFFERMSERCHAPVSLGALVAALRGYFRFRATAGDRVHGLIGALSYPANWQQASLPKSLTDAEIERLVNALDRPGPSMRRSAAMVRCALDLGLRSGEIAALGLDDVDWRAGTLTLPRTKGRREQVLPLPEATGRALAAYLKYERPRTVHRRVFVRQMAPREERVGPDLVRKTIRQAYQRAGLPYTRSHLLRHTMARRLLSGGSSIKEVADVLRHRSLNTTLIYAKLDSRNLRAVALPWPGSAS